MKLAPVLFVLLAGSAMAAAACTITEGDGDGGGGTDDTTTTSFTNEGGSGTGGEGGASLTCEEQCEASVPAASIETWATMLGCTNCGACYDICDGGSGNVCIEGEELGCSAGAADCDTCINSACAQTDTCGFEVDACLADPNCIAFNDCYAACPVP